MNPVGNRRNCKNKPGKKRDIVRRMGCGTSKPESSPEPQVRARDANLALENIGEDENDDDDSALEISTGFYSPPALHVQNVETQGAVQNDEQSIMNPTESETSEENNSALQTPTSNNESADAEVEIPPLCIPKTTFKRIAKSYICKYKRNYRLSCDASDILQFASEDYMAGVFRDSMKCCFHRRRKTVSVDDMKLVMDLRESNPHRVSLPTPTE